MVTTKNGVLTIVFALLCMPSPSFAQMESRIPIYDQARWDPIHFKPAIAQATDEQCLACHQEVLDRKPLQQSPAGIKADDTMAWYQTLSTYSGDQSTFHWRHIVSPYSQSVMDMKCNTCHQGNDPRDETSSTSSTDQPGLTMRKMVDPYVCAMCHGQFNTKKMGIPESWYKSSHLFGDNCLTCHAAIRTERHKHTKFLKAADIEDLGKQDSDACFGCHGGRAWYRIVFPYLQPDWPGWGSVPEGMSERYELLQQDTKLLQNPQISTGATK